MTDYEKYLEKQVDFSKIKKRLEPGDTIYLQNDQLIQKGIVVKISEKSVKVNMDEGIFKNSEKNFPYTKIVKEGDHVVLVWEAWRGLQGRGGYRWEREAYENIRIAVEKIPLKAVVCEESFLQVNMVYEQSYLSKINNINKNVKISLK